MKPRVLILDDTQERHDSFAKMLGDSAEVKHVYTVDEAKRALIDSARWDLVMLDNDLETENHEREGREVADFISTKLALEKRPFSVIVHSWNPDAARWMVSMLKQAGYKYGKNLVQLEYGTFNLVPPADGGRIAVVAL